MDSHTTENTFLFILHGILCRVGIRFCFTSKRCMIYSVTMITKQRLVVVFVFVLVLFALFCFTVREKRRIGRKKGDCFSMRNYP